MKVERISAVTLKVNDMSVSVKFYRDVLGLKLIYGGENGSFSSLRTNEEQHVILNLEQGGPARDWGRLIFYVDDVDACRQYLKDRGFNPEIPRDAPWQERYFHMRDPDGHELSFARPLK
jgi:catechol 2,3-dioxygenase-like lactoylglutathione lyase family enzyme